MMEMNNGRMLSWVHIEQIILRFSPSPSLLNKTQQTILSFIMSFLMISDKILMFFQENNQETSDL